MQANKHREDTYSILKTSGEDPDYITNIEAGIKLFHGLDDIKNSKTSAEGAIELQVVTDSNNNSLYSADEKWQDLNRLKFDKDIKNKPWIWESDDINVISVQVKALSIINEILNSNIPDFDKLNIIGQRITRYRSEAHSILISK